MILAPYSYRPLPPERELVELTKLYQGACYELATVGGGWLPAHVGGTQAPIALLSAWNPESRLLGPAVNAGRDQLLAEELASCSIAAQRSRGRAADGSWMEEGWGIPAEPLERVVQLLCRYGQLAAVLIDMDGRRLQWRDGRSPGPRF